MLAKSMFPNPLQSILFFPCGLSRPDHTTIYNHHLPRHHAASRRRRNRVASKISEGLRCVLRHWRWRCASKFSGQLPSHSGYARICGCVNRVTWTAHLKADGGKIHNCPISYRFHLGQHCLTCKEISFRIDCQRWVPECLIHILCEIPLIVSCVIKKDPYISMCLPGIINCLR